MADPAYQFARYPSLEGRTVIVTGGASGIGAEIVRGFAEQGAKVGFLDFDRETSERLVEETRDATGATVEHALADLRDVDALRGAVADLHGRLGPAWALVNNAARDDRHDWREVTPEYFDERVAANVRHMFFMIQAVVPQMIEAGRGGAIVNMGSNSWWEKGTGMPAYTLAKSAVHGLTRSSAKEFGDHRIRVNCVVPGWIMTERQKELWATPEALEKHRQNQCLPDLIDPVHVARMVLFLCSDDAAFCTASNFFVEGGSV